MNGTVESVTSLSHIAHRIALASEEQEVFEIVAAAAREHIGQHLCTVMIFNREAMQVQRVYSSDPDAYPAGGAKDKRDSEWGSRVLLDGQYYIGRNQDDIKQHFNDFEVIFALGLHSILNVPVMSGGRVVGTVNMLNQKADFYAESQLQWGQVLAGLLAPTLLTRSG